MATYDNPVFQSVEISNGDASASAALTIPKAHRATRCRIKSFGAVKTGANALFTGTVQVGTSTDADAYQTFTFTTAAAAGAYTYSQDLSAFDVSDADELVITTPGGGNGSDDMDYFIVLEWF